MESRRIQLVGKRSYAISLPKEWIVHNKLKNKDQLFIEQTENNELLIKKSYFVLKEKKEMTITLEDIQNVKEFVVFCYVKNIDKLKIAVKKSDYDKISLVRHILNHLEGYEITHEDERSIEISFVFNDVNIDLNHIMRRMMYLLKLMVTSLNNRDIQNVDDAEQSMDRLYHLSRRNIIACMHNQKMREDNHIKDMEELAYIKEIVTTIENIGDILYTMKEMKIHQKEYDVLDNLVLILEKLFDKKNEIEMKNDIKNLKIPSRDKEIQYKIRTIQELGKQLVQHFISIQFNKKYFS